MNRLYALGGDHLWKFCFLLLVPAGMWICESGIWACLYMDLDADGQTDECMDEWTDGSRLLDSEAGGGGSEMLSLRKHTV